MFLFILCWVVAAVVKWACWPDGEATPEIRGTPNPLRTTDVLITFYGWLVNKQRFCSCPEFHTRMHPVCPPNVSGRFIFKTIFFTVVYIRVYELQSSSPPSLLVHCSLSRCVPATCRVLHRVLYWLLYWVLYWALYWVLYWALYWVLQCHTIGRCASSCATTRRWPTNKTGTHSEKQLHSATSAQKLYREPLRELFLLLI